MAHAEAPTEKKTAWTIQEVKVLVDYYADTYKVSRRTMHSVVACESGYNTRIVGDGGKSVGLAQIYAPAHPEISYEEKVDPYFALDFMARSISKGKGSMWTCYRRI